MKRNILLIIISVALASVLSVLLGKTLSQYIFPYGTDWIIPEQLIYFVNTFPFIYLFLLPFTFVMWGKGKIWIWIIMSILPIIIFDLYIGSDVWYWLAAFFVVGIVLSFIFKKLFKRSNS